MDRNPQKDCLIGWFEFEIEFIFTNKENKTYMQFVGNSQRED